MTNLLKLNLDFKMNLGEQNDILKVIRSPNLERRSNLGLLVIPVILLPVILDAFKRSNKTLVIFDLNDHITSLLPYGLSENKLFETLIDKFTNFSLWLVLPIFLITFAESLRKEGKFFENLNFTSIGRIKFSEGFKGADYWYWFLNWITIKIPFLLTFLTIGYTSLTRGAEKGFSAWLTKLSDTIFPSSLNIFHLTIIFIISTLIVELINYIRHWILHNVGLFWDLHEFHHSATEMTILSRMRVAPIESIFLDFLLIPFPIFFGLIISKSLATGSILLLSIQIMHTILNIFSDVFGHSSLKIIYPKPIRYFIMSPSCHWLHHSSNPEHYNCNYGATYTLWDRVFGTYLDERHINNIYGFGVENTQYNKHHPIYAMYFLPFSKILRRFRKTINNNYCI